MVPIDIEYHYLVQPEIEHHYYVHGDSPNYSAANVTVFEGQAPEWVLNVSLPKESNPPEFGEINNPFIMCETQLNLLTNSYYHHDVYKIWNAFDAETFSDLKFPSIPRIKNSLCIPVSSSEMALESINST